MSSVLILLGAQVGGPNLTGITPATAPAGASTLTLVCTGTGFTPSTVVRWNGTDRTTTYVSTTRLDATIPAVDLTTPGTATVTVV